LTGPRHSIAALAAKVAASRASARTLVSILVPLFNEETYIGECLARVLNAPLPESISLEIIVVDDGSTDRSAEVALRVQDEYPGVIRVIRHPRNLGKGAAIRTAIEHASGEFCLIQDADLEYSPIEYRKLLEPLVSGKADAVFGSRFVFTSERRVLYFWHAVANRVITTFCNMVADLNLTDMETCYKAARTSLLKSIPIRSDRFGIEPELTLKLAQRRARIYEIPISYHGRTYEEGKKIRTKDALQALWVICRFGFFQRDIFKDRGSEILDTLASAPRFNAWMADAVRPFLGETVLEIGAGLGNLAGLLCRNKKRYIASDIDEEHLARLRGRFEHHRSVEVAYLDVERPEDFVPFERDLDSVVCLNVLEHTRNDTLGLANIFSVLRPGGRAVILVPYGADVYGGIDEVLGHYRRYSEPELRSKLEEAGFQIETVIEFNKPARPGWFVNGRIFKRDNISRFQVFVYDRLVWLWRKLDPILPLKPTSIIAVGVRRA